jgi:anti-sigma B factor antagonist
VTFLPPEPFRVDVVRSGDRVLVTPGGEVDIATSPSLQEAFDGIAYDGVRLLVLDLRDVEFMDSTGIAVVHRIDELARERGLSFVVVRGRDSVQRVFNLTGLDHVLAFVDSLDELP